MMKTGGAGRGSDPGRERGQMLVLFALMLMVLLGFAALTIDVGLAYMERRSLQNAVDAAALAAARDMVQGEPQSTAEATAIDYLQRHGFSNLGDIEINMPPTSGAYAGMSGYIQVKAGSDAPTAFLGLFRDGPFALTAQAVAEGKPGSETSGTGDPGGGGDGGGSSTPIPPANVPNVDCGSPTVDGRVTTSDGYTKIGDLVSGSTDYGDVFYACDATDLYFAMVLNGPDTGGGVANENVYQCDAAGSSGQVQLQGNKIKKLKGFITWVGTSSFTMDAGGEVWTVDIDGSTTIEVDKQPATINDLASGQEVDVKGNVVGNNYALATKVKAKTAYGACGGAFSATYHADYDTGWVESPKGTHTFKDLWKSDRARFQIACDGVARHDFVQDYLIDDGGGSWSSAAADDGEVVVAGPTASASSMEWNLEHPADTGWGDDPGEDPLVQSPPFNAQYPNYDLEYDGWVWEMLYEFKVAAAPYDSCTGPIQFGLHDFSGSVGPLEGIHSSPAKNEEGVWLQIEASVLRLVE